MPFPARPRLPRTVTATLRNSSLVGALEDGAANRKPTPAGKLKVGSLTKTLC